MTASQHTVLVVDDEQPVRQVLSTLLKTERFNVLEAADGKECLRMAYDCHPDLVLLDIMMPDRDGRDICRRLREISNVPIIMLTALSEGREKVDRLQDGADDYVTKPFHNEELVARIRAVLRRSHQSPEIHSLLYQDSILRIDVEARQLLLNGAPVSLSPKLWRLLECLIVRRDRLVTREELLRYGWGDGYQDERNYLKVFISHLRRKLGDDGRQPRYIHTEPRQGYWFETHN